MAVPGSAGITPALSLMLSSMREFTTLTGRRPMLTDRRIFLSAMAGLLAMPARAQAPAMSRITAFAFHFAGLRGGDIQLAEHAGKPILIVNTASPSRPTPHHPAP